MTDSGEDGPLAGGDIDDTADVTNDLARIRRNGEVTGAASGSWSGSTMIARRESRRRSARAGDPGSDPAGGAADVPDALGGLSTAALRAAVAPATRADSADAYPVRTAEALVVPRRPATPRDPAEAGATPQPLPPPPGQAARRLAARRLLTIVGGGAAMVIVGITALVLLLSLR